MNSMPLIDHPYILTDEDLDLIEKWKASGKTHRDWGCKELEPLRVRIRAYYRLKQKGICAYCANEVSVIAANNANIEHILPKSHYQKFIFETKNMCIICADCNQAKGNSLVENEQEEIIKGEAIRYPSASARFKIIHPLYDEYNDHIKKRKLAYIGITKKGLKTIAICDLNRFARNYGYESVFLEDIDIMQLLQKFSTGDRQEQIEVFNKFREILP
ncbi:HNH endonuclease [Pseudomonas aeruginosa]|uniref:HNH endonuclease n=1 Tax=Pseudomonas aeruginosa TaxID=287 RepID=UPI0020D1D8DC|nr:HNH endonuclease [Pseudomonas aeruginosa]WGW34389.1 HNH endonuclease domain-containing protein [Pseudomonas aeruginosa]WGW46993.1 HNH endonuclease domain-containing protein [Pseudomonas aeruginosa]WGW59702.1 HNH endonuclease domain-containing protein [Pseudomonas aeruginosa]